MIEFLALAQECAPTVAPQTMAAIVKVESDYNPYAIGIVGGKLTRQPLNKAEAIQTAKELAKDGWNFSVGIAQINKKNLPKYKLSYEEAFTPCKNLEVGSKILAECFTRAQSKTTDPQNALKKAISCYYSGNFTRGFIPDKAGQASYVQKVLASNDISQPIPIVPAINSDDKAKPVVLRRTTPSVKHSIEYYINDSSVLIDSTQSTDDEKSNATESDNK